jgi:hypothetical protein
MKSIFALLGLVLFGLVVLAPVSASQAQDCKKVTVKTCPSFFADRCRNDEAFQKENGFACLGVIRNRAKDQAFCAKVDMSQCQAQVKAPRLDCDKETNPVAKFYCKKNVSGCPYNVPQLQSSYTKIIDTYNSELSQYDEALDVEPGQMGKLSIICKFTTANLDKYLKTSKRDKSGLKRFDGELSHLKVCSDTMVEFLDEGPIKGITDSAWEDIKNGLSEGLQTIVESQGKIATKRDKLANAEEKIQSLKDTHLLACPQTPVAPTSSDG